MAPSSIHHAPQAQQLPCEQGAVFSGTPLGRPRPVQQFGQALRLAAYVLGLTVERQRQGGR